MKLMFIVADLHTPLMRLMYENTTVAPRARAVTIDLTPEQIEQIGLRKVGVDSGKTKYEEITGVFIQPEEDVSQ